MIRNPARFLKESEEEEGGGIGEAIFRRMFEEGPGAFDLADIADSIATLDALRIALDGLDSTANNVTFTNAAGCDAV